MRLAKCLSSTHKCTQNAVIHVRKPPDHAVVLWADERSRIQALDCTQTGLPMKKVRCGTMTYDYKRNGTATLFAALDALECQVVSCATTATAIRSG